MLAKSAKSLVIIALVLLMGSAAKVQAGVLSGDRINSAAIDASNQSLQSWRPYHAEFSDVVPYLSAWALFGQQSSLDRCQPEIAQSARAASSSDSGLPIDNPTQLHKIDNTPDCQTGSAGAGSSAPERPPVPQSGLSADTEHSVSQMVMLLVLDNQSLSIPKQVFRLFRPPRLGSLS